MVRSESGYSLGEQGKLLLGVGLCPDAKIETGLLPGHSFSIFAHISFMWAKTPLALTSGLPNGSLAGALNKPCGTMVGQVCPGGHSWQRGDINAVLMQMTDSEGMCIWGPCNVLPQKNDART